MMVVVRHPEMNSAWGVRFVSDVSPVAVEALPPFLPCLPDVGRVTSLNSLTKSTFTGTKHSLVLLPSSHT